MSHRIVPPRVYAIVVVILMILLGATVMANRVDLGPLNIVVALAIAGVKAALVVLYFMEVRYSSRLTWIFAGAGFFWLIILIGLTLSDTLNRDVVVSPFP